MPPTRPRYSPPSFSSSSFGAGALTPAVRALIVANVVMFLITELVPELKLSLGLHPAAFLRGSLWQPMTYMFLHGGLFHLLFNMLTLWMIGVELERRWGTLYFSRFYFICGLGAAVAMVSIAMLPGRIGEIFINSLVIGASGAIFGLLVAFALYYPDRQFLFLMLFPLPAKYFVLLLGAIGLYSSIFQAGNIAHGAHLGGAFTGYLYLKGGRMRPMAELTYRYQRWKIDRHRRKFDVYPGGRGPGPRVH